MRGVQQAQRLAYGDQRVSTARQTDGGMASPDGLAVLLGQRRGSSDSNEGVARPYALLSGFQQVGARLVPGQFAIEPDGRFGVGKQPAVYRNDPPLHSQLAELLQSGGKLIHRSGSPRS